VVVSIPPLKYFVERITGRTASVTVMLARGRSPATYEPTPRQMAQLAEAAVYFRIGMPFEDVWLERTAAQLPGLRVVDCPADLDEDLRSRPDPHLWTSPREAQGIASCMKSVLVKLRPGSREDFETNYGALSRDLELLDTEIATLLAAGGTSAFLIFHPALGYFAQAYGLQQVAIERDGKEPSARQLIEIIDWARNRQVREIFVQKEFSQAVVKSLAEEIGADIVVIDPLAENYLDNMRAIALAIAGRGTRR